MKITDIIPRIVSYPVPREKQHRNDYGWAVKFDNNYVEVRTDEGIVGYGASLGPALSVKTIIEHNFKPLLIGEDPTMVERLWQKMYCNTRCDKALEKGYMMPIFMRRGDTMAAISAIDMALWDIVGKKAGLPLYKILGACREKVRTYASGGWATADKIGEELKSYLTPDGHKAVKMRAEGREGEFTIQKSIERVAAAREALGPDIGLAVDAHCSLDVPTAILYARELEKYNVAWLEEPISADNHAGLQKIQAHTTTPLSTGEHELSRFDFHDVMKHGGVDILQPDIGICGGISEARRIADIASCYSLKIASHNWGNPLLLAASLHYALSTPNYSIFEVGKSASPLMMKALVKMPEIRDGYIYPPEKPGIGVEFTPGFFEEYHYVEGPEYVYNRD